MKMSAITFNITLRCIITCTHSNNTSANKPTKEATTSATPLSRAMESLPNDYNESGSDIDYVHYVSDDSDNDLTDDDDESSFVPHRYEPIVFLGRLMSKHAIAGI